MSPGEVRIEVKLGHPRWVFFFDQFGIVREDGFVHIHLGFKSGGFGPGGLIIVIGEDIVAANKENFLKYLHEIGLPEKSIPSDFRVRDARNVVFADMMGVARHGNTTEFLFHCFSWKLLVDRSRVNASKTKGKETPVAESHCVAIVRSAVEIHRNLIDTMYASDSEE